MAPPTGEPPRFFWVNHEQDKSQKKALERYKHSFLKNKHYEARKNRSMQHLISRCQERHSHYDRLQWDGDVVNQASEDDNKDQTDSSQKKIDDNTGSTFSFSEIVLSRPPTIRVIDNLPSSPDCRADKSDIYFHHCE
ncbi:hypothetical protein PENSUB_6142 [Penicillium subrubescens]|uniref:Uncharacterized protein n=1 Tax=Penicillium subrubescens TaxID=1316194 RepID=A0A1Q5U3A5_9EURO|nr:hypothetical protein PENSUB_6142 [Penicillium subrubescens]